MERLKKFLVDNSLGFDNAEYKQLTEQFNVEICATTAYSTWLNGIHERNHYVIYMYIQKMIEDPKMELLPGQSMQKTVCKTILGIVQFKVSWVTTQIYHHLWRINFQEAEMSDTVIKHLNALHATRKAYTKQNR